ncbi:hypothetical protein HaLaN_17757 [Haematococcus lacustris]|uniref:F-box domain-containing protein n=1 Tax=Haematococcus lacustris TaxID=44745 RepID=A0A699ZD40_HAELA|nr:hypothetical protein HaLaN_17757 [Haematococcus lacustris]
MPQRSATLLDTLESFPGVSLIVYSYLLRDRCACRLVCKRLRTVIDGNTTHVTIHLRHRLAPTSTVEDTMERFARSSLRPTILSLTGTSGPGSAEVANELSSALSAPSHKPLAALQAVRELCFIYVPALLHLSMALAVVFRRCEKLSFVLCDVNHRSCRTWQHLEQLSCLELSCVQISYVGNTAATNQPRLGELQLIRGLTFLKLVDIEVWQTVNNRGMPRCDESPAQEVLRAHYCLRVDESCLAACTQLTRLQCGNSFPGLSQLTQLRRVGMHEMNSLSVVTELASLPHLARLCLGSWVSTDQLGSSQRFMFPSLTCLEVSSINASLLAALDCPQLQRLVFRTESDTYKCLCVDSVPSLHACAGSLLKHCSFVRLKCGPTVTLTAVLKALAPWQPSAAALSSTRMGMGLLVGGEDAISASHLELLPTGLQDLSFMGCTLLPGALHPVATRLTQLQVLELQDASDCSEEDLQLLACHSVQGRRLTVQLDTSYTAEFVASLQCLSDMTGQWSGRPGPRFRSWSSQLTVEAGPGQWAWLPRPVPCPSSWWVGWASWVAGPASMRTRGWMSTPGAPTATLCSP